MVATTAGWPVDAVVSTSANGSNTAEIPPPDAGSFLRSKLGGRGAEDDFFAETDFLTGGEGEGDLDLSLPLSL